MHGKDKLKFSKRTFNPKSELFHIWKIWIRQLNFARLGCDKCNIDVNLFQYYFRVMRLRKDCPG